MRLLVVLVTLCALPTALAQTGGLVGTVTDSTGAALSSGQQLAEITVEYELPFIYDYGDHWLLIPGKPIGTMRTRRPHPLPVALPWPPVPRR